MADSKISALTAVTTPASTDEFAVNQGGTSLKMTRAQIHALQSGEHLVLPQVDEQATPTIAFGDGDTGFYESADDVMNIAVNGAVRWRIDVSFLGSSGSNRPGFVNEAPTTTNPVIVPAADDLDTGISTGGADQLSLIAGAIEAVRFTEVSSHVLQQVQANVGLTADSGSAQGNGVILSSYNVYSTVGSAGDAATLPATFAVGTIVHVKNSAATNSMDVFPASGDDAGAGTDTAVAVAAGAFAVFMCTTADATWTKIAAGGTA